MEKKLGQTNIFLYSGKILTVRQNTRRKKTASVGGFNQEKAMSEDHMVSVLIAAEADARATTDEAMAKGLDGLRAEVAHARLSRTQRLAHQAQASSADSVRGAL